MTFNDSPIFGASPLRVQLEPRGELLTPRAAIGLGGGGSIPGGPFDLALTITGRFIAESPGQLQSLLDTALAALTTPPTRGELVDDQGRIWPAISFVKFECIGPAERGRVCSQAFSARFVGLHE